MNEDNQYTGADAFVQALAQLTESSKNMRREAVNTISESLLQYTRAIAESANEVMVSAMASAMEAMAAMIDSLKESASQTQMSNLALLGVFEWCFYSVVSPEDVEFSGNKLMQKLHGFLDCNDEASREEVDEFVSGLFPDAIIENIAAETMKYLEKPEQEKISRAIMHYKEERYYEAASLLAGLIDSYNIKQNLIDIDSGKCGDQKIKQGWGAFVMVFDNNLAEQFKGQTFNGSNREERFLGFVDSIKQDWRDNKLLMPYVNLAFCLLQFFDANDWRNYPELPLNLNRNWLMHGMYDLDDITEIDCKKLFLICNRLAALYSTLPDQD